MDFCKNLCITVLLLFLKLHVRDFFFIMCVSEAGDHQHQHLDAEMQGSMRLFRAQRNFYISGFALFLSLVSFLLIGIYNDLQFLMYDWVPNFFLFLQKMQAFNVVLLNCKYFKTLILCFNVYFLFFETENSLLKNILI